MHEPIIGNITQTDHGGSDLTESGESQGKTVTKTIEYKNA